MVYIQNGLILEFTTKLLISYKKISKQLLEMLDIKVTCHHMVSNYVQAFLGLPTWHFQMNLANLQHKPSIKGGQSHLYIPSKSWRLAISKSRVILIQSTIWDPFVTIIYYKYFHTLFYLHMFSKNTNNVIKNRFPMPTPPNV